MVIHGLANHRLNQTTECCLLSKPAISRLQGCGNLNFSTDTESDYLIFPIHWLPFCLNQQTGGWAGSVLFCANQTLKWLAKSSSENGPLLYLPIQRCPDSQKQAVSHLLCFNCSPLRSSFFPVPISQLVKGQILDVTPGNGVRY